MRLKKLKDNTEITVIRENEIYNISVYKSMLIFEFFPVSLNNIVNVLTNIKKNNYNYDSLRDYLRKNKFFYFDYEPIGLFHSDW